MKTFFGRSIFSFILAIAACSGLFAQTGYDLTVHAGGRQTFKSFGASQVTDTNIPSPAREEMTDLVYGDLGMKVLRLWLGTGSGVSVQTMKNAFYNQYVNNNTIGLIQSRIPGVTTLLLGPALGHNQPGEPIPDYSAKIAEFILEVKNERGVLINVTGVANEPGAWTTQQMVDAVKYLRLELDKRGLNYVKIIAPECASNDADLNNKLDGLHNDPEAWNSLFGIASHSYNMAATQAQVNRAHGKDFWITEASNNGNEPAEDEDMACIAAARFLNDMNHSVTDWVWFIGYGLSNNVVTDNDNATKLMVYDKATSKVFIHLKYYYFKQLLTAFDTGSIFRRVTSATEADMPYTYGQKPAVNAAAARNPDGSWAVGIVNETGRPGYPPLSNWYPAQTYQMNVSIEELAGTGTQTFKLYRSSAGHHFEDAGMIEVTDGHFSVVVAPEELVTLRSPAIPKISAIIWPEIPDSLKNTAQWKGDSLSAFKPDTSQYVVALPYGTTNVPQLFPIVTDPNVVARIHPAISLYGSEEERTTVFTLTSGEGLELLSYKILFTIVAGGNMAGISTIRSQDYQIIEGPSGLQNVLGVDTGTAVNDFFNHIIKEDPGQSLEIHSVLDGSIRTVGETVSDQDTLVVISADGQNTTEYLITVHEGGPYSDAVLTSSFYTVMTDTLGGTGTIAGMDYETSIIQVLDSIIKPETANLAVTGIDGESVSLKTLNFKTEVVNTLVNEEIFFKVTAQDGITIITYRLQPAGPSGDALVFSNVYEVNQEGHYIRFIPSGTDIPTFLQNIIPVAGSVVAVTDTMGIKHTSGKVSADFKLKVTSADGTSRNSYVLIPMDAVIWSDVYLVDNGRISGIDTATTASEFLANIIKSDPGQNLEVHRSSDGTMVEAQQTVSDGDTLIVSIGGQDYTWLISLTPGGLDSDALLTSEVYDITSDPDAGTGTVSGMHFGMTVGEVLDSIQVPLTANLYVLDTDYHSVSLSTLISDSIRFIVVSQDRRITMDYAVQLTIRDNEAYVLSNLYEVSQDQKTIRQIPYATPIYIFLQNIIPVPGAHLQVLNASGQPQDLGNIDMNFSLEVTSKDGSKTVSYDLMIKGGEAWVTSDSLTVDQENKVISGISSGMEVAEFLGLLTLAPEARVMVVDKFIQTKTSGPMEEGDIIMVVSGNGKSVVEYTLEFKIVLGLTHSQGISIKVFPNPMKDEIYIRGVQREFKIKIANVLGMNLLENQGCNEISVGHLPPGIYLIKIMNRDGSIVYCQKFFKE